MKALFASLALALSLFAAPLAAADAAPPNSILVYITCFFDGTIFITGPNGFSQYAFCKKDTTIAIQIPL